MSSAPVWARRVALTRLGRSRGLPWPALALLSTVLVGLLTGALWWLLAPLARADVVGGSVYLTGHAELQAAQDGWFAIVLGALGLLTATVLSWRGAAREPGQTVLLTVALALVSLIAWRTGVLLGPDGLRAQVTAGSRHPLTPLKLHAYGVLLVGPFIFALTRLLAAILGAPARRRTR